MRHRRLAMLMLQLSLGGAHSQKHPPLMRHNRRGVLRPSVRPMQQHSGPVAWVCVCYGWTAQHDAQQQSPPNQQGPWYLLKQPEDMQQAKGGSTLLCRMYMYGYAPHQLQRRFTHSWVVNLVCSQNSTCKIVNNLFRCCHDLRRWTRLTGAQA